MHFSHPFRNLTRSSVRVGDYISPKSLTLHLISTIDDVMEPVNLTVEDIFYTTNTISKPSEIISALLFRTVPLLSFRKHLSIGRSREETTSGSYREYKRYAEHSPFFWAIHRCE